MVRYIITKNFYKYGFTLTTGSDSEIILHLFKEIGIEKTVKALDGVFMFVIYDEIMISCTLVRSCRG